MTDQYPKLRHNFAVFGIDYIFFAVALGFMNFNTVVPTFAVRLGASEALVGVVITILLLSWSLPQLVAGNIVARQKSKKKIIIRMALIGRPAILALALLVALTRGEPPWLSLVALCLAFVIFFGTDAFSAIAWLDLLGQSFPAHRRGSFVGLWQVGKAIGLLGVAALVAFVLSEQGLSFPHNYALLFGSAGLCLGLSIVAIALIHEKQDTGTGGQATYVPWRDFGPHLLRLWREDRRFRTVSIARAMFTLSTMAFPFYVLYATQELRLPTQSIGLFILAQTVGTSLASLSLGRVADRRGAQRTIQIGASIALTAPLLALAITLSDGGVQALLIHAYVWIYVCIGLTENLFMLGYLNYVYDITPDGQRAIYMGTFNAIASIGMLGPIIAGWLLSRTSYSALFVCTLALGITALLLALRLPLARELGNAAAAASAPSSGSSPE